MLLAIKQHLMTQQSASLLELATVVKSDPEAVRSALGIMLRKGKIVCTQKTAACGSRCQQCSPLSTEMYTWVR
jgi:FeoC like transcriptional regulator